MIKVGKCRKAIINMNHGINEFNKIKVSHANMRD